MEFLDLFSSVPAVVGGEHEQASGTAATSSSSSAASARDASRSAPMENEENDSWMHGAFTVSHDDAAAGAEALERLVGAAGLGDVNRMAESARRARAKQASGSYDENAMDTAVGVIDLGDGTGLQLSPEWAARFAASQERRRLRRAGERRAESRLQQALAKEESAKEQAAEGNVPPGCTESHRGSRGDSHSGITGSAPMSMGPGCSRMGSVASVQHEHVRSRGEKRAREPVPFDERAMADREEQAQRQQQETRARQRGPQTGGTVASSGSGAAKMSDGDPQDPEQQQQQQQQQQQPSARGRGDEGEGAAAEHGVAGQMGLSSYELVRQRSRIQREHAKKPRVEQASTQTARHACGRAGSSLCRCSESGRMPTATCTKARQQGRMPKRRAGRTKPLKAVMKQGVKSLKHARVLTSRFHELLQQKSAAEANRTMKPKEKAKAVQEIQQKIDAMGGLDKYQQASVAATAAFKTSKFVFQQLTRLGLRGSKGQEPPPGLEIGAVNTQLCTCPWLKVRSIDMNSQDRRIEQLNFFDVPVPPRTEERLAFIVNAMVINCVPSPLQRGEMLSRCRELLVPGGLMFLMLPRRCLMASPWMTPKVFELALAAAGFRKVLARRDTPKICMLLLQRDCATGPPTGPRARAGAAAAAGAAGCDAKASDDDDGQSPPTAKKARVSHGTVLASQPVSNDRAGAGAGAASGSSTSAAKPSGSPSRGVEDKKVPKPSGSPSRGVEDKKVPRPWWAAEPPCAWRKRFAKLGPGVDGGADQAGPLEGSFGPGKGSIKSSQGLGGVHAPAADSIPPSLASGSSASSAATSSGGGGSSTAQSSSASPSGAAGSAGTSRKRPRAEERSAVLDEGSVAEGSGRLWWEERLRAIAQGEHPEGEHERVLPAVPGKDARRLFSDPPAIVGSGIKGAGDTARFGISFYRQTTSSSGAVGKKKG